MARTIKSAIHQSILWINTLEAVEHRWCSRLLMAGVFCWQVDSAWGQLPALPVIPGLTQATLVVTQNGAPFSATPDEDDDLPEFQPEPPVSALAPVYARPLTAPEREALQQQVKQLFAQLDHPDFLTRERAEESLAALTPRAVSTLPETWNTASLEAKVRLANVLKTWMATADDHSLEQICDLLENLEQVSSSTLAIAKAAMRQHEQRTSELAIRQFEKLGGVIEKQVGVFGLRGRIPANEADEEDFKRYAVIGRGYKGGDAGLHYLTRIPRLDLVYYVKSAAITPRALAELQGDLPGLQIQERGLAYLGVTSNQGETPMRLSIVKTGSPADKAGLKEEDLVLRFGGQEVSTFDHLVKLIGEKSPGDKVEVDILRDGQRKQLVVELGEWSK